MKLRFFAAAIFIIIIVESSFAQQEVTLEQVVALALEKNYDVRIARNSQEATAIDQRYSNAALMPNINATGSRVWNNNDQEQQLRREGRSDTLIVRDNIRSNNLQASLQLTWTLFDGTRMFVARERIAETNLQSEMLLRDQMVNTIAQVISNYYNIVRQKQQLKAIEELIGVNEERVKLADRKLQVGSGVKPELLQARVDLNEQRAFAIQQETIIQQLKDQLNGYVSFQLPREYDVADTIVINQQIARQDIESNIENNNYSLQAARQNIEIARLFVKERRAEYFPTINFNSAYNFSKTENAVAINNFTPLFNQNKGLNYGFSVAVPIFNGFNQRRLVQQSHINLNRQRILYDRQKMVVDVALANAFVNYENAKRILQIEEETIGAARENVSIAFQTFKAGATTSVELRIAQQSLADAYSRLISARYNAKLAETELLRLNGSLLK